MQSVKTEAIVAFCIPLTYAILWLLETVRPGVRRPVDLRWQAGGVLFFTILGVVNNLVGHTFKRLLPLDPIFNGGSLGIVSGVVVAYLLVSLGNALLHRAYHRSELLWRWVHRFHHQPQRLDVAGVMYQTPLEMVANALLFTAVTVYLLGLPPLQMMLCAYVASVFGMFQHLNTSTPRWLGILVQRPEAHSMHHRKHLHAWNYSDLPLWDVLMGTYRNPTEFEQDLGIDVKDFGSERMDRHGVSGWSITFAVRSLLVVWLVFYLPVYASAYGYWHFLQLCNLSVLISCLGFLTSNRLLLSMQSLAAPLIGVLWVTDIATYVSTGHFLHGGTAYLWDVEIPWPARLLSVYHLILPLILIAAIRRSGYDKRALACQVALAGFVYFASIQLYQDCKNLNYSQSWPNGCVLFEDVWKHAVATWALLCLLVYLPTHLLWNWLFTKGSSQPTPSILGNLSQGSDSRRRALYSQNDTG